MLLFKTGKIRGGKGTSSSGWSSLSSRAALLCTALLETPTVKGEEGMDQQLLQPDALWAVIYGGKKVMCVSERLSLHFQMGLQRRAGCASQLEVCFALLKQFRAKRVQTLSSRSFIFAVCYH